MAETIRERIEREAKEPFCDFGWPLIREWGKGNLIPRDEHEAAVAEAVRAERQKAVIEPQVLSRLRDLSERLYAEGLHDDAGDVAEAASALAAAISEKDKP